jgi:hypothetical protein
MNRPSDQLLAGPALTDDKNRTAGASCCLDPVVKTPHLKAGTDKVVKDAPFFSRHQCRLSLERLDASPALADDERKYASARRIMRTWLSLSKAVYISNGGCGVGKTSYALSSYR